MNCAECDAELEPDEPQTCYFTGRGPCGDCRDPRTNQPPYPGGCFHPVLCDDCLDAAAVVISPRQRRRQQISDMLETREYREKRKEELRSKYGGRYA